MPKKPLRQSTDATVCGGVSCTHVLTSTTTTAVHVLTSHDHYIRSCKKISAPTFMITQIHRYCNSNFYSIGSYIIPPRRFALFYSGKDWIGGRMGAGTARFLLHYSRVGCALCNMYKKTVTLHKNQKTRLNYNFSDVIMWV